MNNEETIIMQPQSGNNPKVNQATPATEPNAKPKKTRYFAFKDNNHYNYI